MRKRRLTVLPVLLLILTLLAPMCAAAEAPALPTEPIPSGPGCQRFDERVRRTRLPL